MGIFSKLFGKKENQERPAREPIVVPLMIPRPDSGNGATTPVKDTDELRERIESVLEEVRPYLQGDGGDVEVVDVGSDGTIAMHFVGACHGCPSATMTLKMGIESTLKERIPEVKEVISV